MAQRYSRNSNRREAEILAVIQRNGCRRGPLSNFGCVQTRRQDGKILEPERRDLREGPDYDFLSIAADFSKRLPAGLLWCHSLRARRRRNRGKAAAVVVECFKRVCTSIKMARSRSSPGKSSPAERANFVDQPRPPAAETEGCPN